MDPAPNAASGSVDRCAEQRAHVATVCAQARDARAEHERSSDRTAELRRRLVAARHEQEQAAEAAEPRLRAEQKAEAREAYERAMGIANDDEERAEATAAWARAVDRINRSGRLTQRARSNAEKTVARLEAELLEAERAEHTARIGAESADTACLDARVRLASCEEGAQAGAAVGAASVAAPVAASEPAATSVAAARQGVPLVIEALLAGDRTALELTATQVAEHIGLGPAETLLQLQELVDAIVSAASHDGYLVFDDDHPFWSHLAGNERGDVIAALARLGFQFEPTEGWHAGRSPTPMDLSMALAYAGLDARSMRDLPTADQLRALPQSISVDARAYLADRAPDLAVDQLVGLLEGRATRLESLWNDWGQIRPILLSDRSALDATA